jgi:hypothetical protein
VDAEPQGLNEKRVAVKGRRDQRKAARKVQEVASNNRLITRKGGRVLTTAICSSADMLTDELVES